MRTRFRRPRVMVAASLLLAWLDAGIAQQPLPEQAAPFGATYDALSDEQRILIDGFFRRAGTVLGATLDAPRAFPAIPRAASKTIDVAVDDFLRSWLVEGQPNLAVAYVDPAAHDCFAAQLGREGQPFDRGLAPLQLFVRMKSIGDRLGPRQSLAGTTRPVRLADPALRVVDHRRQDQYAIYAVPQAMAGQFSCASNLTFGQVPSTPGARVRREDVYETFYSALALDRPNPGGAALGLLWQRRDGFWKIVSYQAVWDDPTANTLPDLRAAVAPAALPTTTADAAVLQANDRFLDAWLIRKNYDEAAALVSSRAYGCVNLFLDPGEPVKATAGEQFARLRAGLERVGVQAGAATRLDEIIASVQPSDRRFGLVQHPRSKAFLLLAVPEWMGPTLNCEARAEGTEGAVVEGGTAPGYGRYYISAVRFTFAGETGPVLALGWVREADGWRIFSFKVIDA